MKKLAVLTLALALFAPALSAQTATSFTGKWEGTFTRQNPDGGDMPARPIVFDLTQKGKALTGKAGPPDQQTEITKGAVAAGKATFEVHPNETQVFKFTLSVVKGRLQGDMVGESGGQVRGRAKVDAGKAKAAAPAK